MDREQWLSSADPDELLNGLPRRGRADARRLRLLACACCRYVWDRLTAPASRRAVEIAEAWADGTFNLEEYTKVRGAATQIYGLAASAAARTLGLHNLYKAACVAMNFTGQAAAETGEQFCDRTRWLAVNRYQAALLHDLFDNLFLDVAIDAAWLRWHGGAIPSLAQAIYDDNRFGDVPVLADMLEEAGCDEVEILRHCRHNAVHVRGCWVVDALRERPAG